MSTIRYTLSLTLATTLTSLAACNGDDSGGVTTDVAMTTAIDTTSRGEVTATGTDSATSTTGDTSTTSTTGVESTGVESTSTSAGGTTSETTGGEDGSCARLAWVHPNPPAIPGGGGPEFYRTFGLDLSACKEKHTVSISMVPSGDNALVLALGDRAPGCILFGAPEAQGVESLGFPVGLSVEWTALTMMVFVDGLPGMVASLPTMVAEPDKWDVLDDLGPRAFFEQDGLWYLAPVGELPHC